MSKLTSNERRTQKEPSRRGVVDEVQGKLASPRDQVSTFHLRFDIVRGVCGCFACFACARIVIF